MLKYINPVYCSLSTISILLTYSEGWIQSVFSQCETVALHEKRYSASFTEVQANMRCFLDQ